MSRTSHYRSIRSRIVRASLCLPLLVAAAVAAHSATPALACLYSCIPPGDSVLAAMQVVDGNGNAISGARVMVQAIPQDDATQINGIAWPQAGTGWTDSTGHVQVSLDSTVTSSTTVADAEGIVNLMVYLVTYVRNSINYTPIYTLPRYFGTDATRAQAFSDAINAASPSVAISAAEADDVVATSWPLGDSDLADYPCGIPFWVYQTSTNAETRIGELHTWYWVQKATFAYGQSADSTIGVGYSYDGGNSWSANGTYHVTSSSAAGQTTPAGTAPWGHQITTAFHYNKYRQYVACNGSTNNYYVQASYWVGGLQNGTDVSQYDGYFPNPNAVYVGPGGTFHTNKETASGNSIAVTVFGATLGAQSGYSSWVKLNWAAKSMAAGCLYGDGGMTPASSHIVFAGPYYNNGDPVKCE